MPEKVSPTTLPQLAQLRRRLTLWYVVTSVVILALLGGSVLWVVRSPREGERHQALREAVRAVARRQASVAAGVEVANSAPDGTSSSAAVRVLTADGRPIRPGDSAAFDPWIRDAVIQAARDGRVEVEHNGPRNEPLFLYAERFKKSDGEARVAVAVTDDEELEDRYGIAIVAFGVAALFAVLIIAAGGWTLVRISTTPIEASIGQMRRFVADAAHELRTPITVLRSRAEVALQQPREPAAYAETLRGIESDARRLAGIVDDLFILSRADAGERPRAHDRIALDDIVVDAANAARVVAERKGVSVALKEYEEAWVDGDTELLRQLVMILLDNAVKFTPSGGTVALQIGSPGSRATIVVEDDGIGIAREHLPHVFNRFYRADPARSVAPAGDGPGGAGLGLSIARWIADVHGAEITAESEPGKGTRMTVRFRPVEPRLRSEASS